MNKKADKKARKHEVKSSTESQQPFNYEYIVNLRKDAWSNKAVKNNWIKFHEQKNKDK